MSQQTTRTSRRPHLALSTKMSLIACSQATLFERDISWMEDIDINISLDMLKKIADMSNGLVTGQV